MIKVCLICGDPFKTKYKNAVVCSRVCSGYLNFHSTRTRIDNRCADCGSPLSISHASNSHPVCDLCMYERRRKYKDNLCFGKLATVAGKARELETVSKIGEEIIKKGESAWLRKHPIWTRKLERLRSIH